jgi:pyoverdine/dityrosine biosynthesis protein Dit1
MPVAGEPILQPFLNGLIDSDITPTALRSVGTHMQSILSTCLHILDVICRYRLKQNDTTMSRFDEGYIKHLATLYRHVKTKSPIRLVLPAFPFKSPNTRTKVLGKLPDKGEEFALAHLNGLCAAIADIYPFGAKLTVVSDGLVYNGKLMFLAFQSHE